MTMPGIVWLRCCVHRTLLVLFALMLGVSGCGNEVESGRHIRIPLGAGGIGFLPLYVMRDRQLLEQHAAAQGVDDLKVDWLDLGGPAAMNDALLSGAVDVIAAGPPAFLTLWDKTQGTLNVKGIAAISALPMYLNSRSPTFASLDVISDRDKIALTSIKVSIPAIIMQMYAADRFGAAEAERFDRYTVSMAHPDGVIAMLSGTGDITAHFTSPPFHQREVRDASVQTILTSDQVMGGTTTFTMLSTTEAFLQANPELVAVIVTALSEAQEWITREPAAAAEILMRADGNAGLSKAEIAALLQDPAIVFSATPANVMRYATFMHSIGSLKHLPESWQSLFVDDIHMLPGS
ncbi:MAG: ABC transporter substrate-binding protein [Gammaproteobacteria bacterium]|nr:ABC transporter substrate-binding protein [Gammaproteobacteria bacterium]